MIFIATCLSLRSLSLYLNTPCLAHSSLPVYVIGDVDTISLGHADRLST